MHVNTHLATLSAAFRIALASLGILTVLDVGNRTKITPTVVGGISVDVVDDKELSRREKYEEICKGLKCWRLTPPPYKPTKSEKA